MDALSVDLVGWVPVDVDELNGGFEAVYQAERRPLLRLAFALTGQWAVAEDLTQEAFLRLHQRWARVSRYDQPGAWLRRVLVNLALPGPAGSLPRRSFWPAWGGSGRCRRP